MRSHGPAPLATTVAETSRAANLEKPWVQRLLCYAALFIVCLAPCISVIALIGWALSMDAEDLRNRIDIDLGIGEQDECDAAYVPGNSSQVITSNENKLEAAVSTNLTTFAVLVGVYVVLHCKEPRRFYRNPLRRGFGPAPPSTAFGWLLVVARMPLDSMVKVASWQLHVWPPRAPQTASEGLGLPFALAGRGPADQIPSRGRGLSAGGHPSCQFHCV